MDIDPAILRSIYAYGFEKPSPIQRRGIKPIVDGRDVIGQAQSGTGKTATFSIGALSRVDVTKNTNQVLIMRPTHELTRQITKVITSLSEMMTGIRIKTIVGSSSCGSVLFISVIYTILYYVSFKLIYYYIIFKKKLI